MFAGFLVSGASFGADTEGIWKLLDDRSGEQAYELARSSLPEDEPDRDLLLGIAAAETGRQDEAITRLKRHLTRYPDHPQNPRARLDLGLGYFQTGQLDAAQAEFEAVLKADPPAPVIHNIHRVLAIIQAERAGRSPQLSAFVAMGLGYDTNINAGVKGATVNLPVFGEIQLNEGSTATKAAVGTVGAGADVNYALRRDLSLFGSVRLDSRFHNDHSNVDQLGSTFSGGAGWMLNRNLLRGSLMWNSMQLNYDTYRNVVTANGEWSRQLDDRTGLGAFGQVGEIDYTGSNALRNAHLYGIGGALTRGFDGAMKPTLRLSASYTIEDNRRDRDDLGRDLLGMRADGEIRLSEKWTANIGYTWQQANHRADDPLFATRRKDLYQAIDLGAGYQLTDKWSTRAEFQYARNDSNLALYEFDRITVMLKLRRDFR